MISEAGLITLFNAIIAKARTSAGLDIRLGPWLTSEPVSLALQIALARTYAACARNYPEYADMLLDESLVSRIAPELAKLLVGKSVDPALFTQYLSVSPGSAELRIRAATEILHWFESELKISPALKPFFDPATHDSLPDLEAKREQLTDDLQRTLKPAIDTAKRYASQVITGERGVAIAGDISNSVIVTGDNVSVVFNTFFTSDFASLSKYYIRPDSVFQRVDVEHFNGRGWLTEKVDIFLNDPYHKSGAFLLTGNAGVGKTAFMAHLVHERRYLHLFAEHFRGEARLQDALISLAVQLVTRYQIESFKDPATLKAVAALPDFLDRLLRLAAEKLTAGEQIVIVCDALDEAGTAAGGNVFGLPKVLPDGVYLILSQRPVNVRLSIEPTLTRFDLHADDLQNLSDIEDFLEAVARQPDIAGQLQAYGYSEYTFTQILKDKSGGNWMYLSYVITEIRQGKRVPLDSTGLPNGLADYYAHYWGRCRAEYLNSGEWDNLYLPLLATLAAAQEPIDVETLHLWSGTNANLRTIRRLLTEEWRSYITLQATGTSVAVKLHHASLRDFLAGRADSTHLTLEGEILCNDLREAVREAHLRIIEHFRQRCDGKWSRLVADDYTRRYLTLHMDEAGLQAEMFALVAMSNVWAEALYRIDGSYAGYLTDLNRAWHRAESDTRWNSGHQIRCAAIRSSIRSVVDNVPAVLLGQAVQVGIWSAARALSYIPQMLNEGQQVAAIRQIAPLVPEELKHEMLMVARGLRDDESRIRALSGIAGVLPADLKPKVVFEALAIVRTVGSWNLRALALSDLASTFPDDVGPQVILEALTTVHEPRSDPHENAIRAQALSKLVSVVSAEIRNNMIREALKTPQSTDWQHAMILIKLVDLLPNGLKSEALELALNLHRSDDRARALSELARVLPDDMKALALREAADAVEKALEHARETSVPHLSVFLLTRLIEILPPELRSTTLDTALTKARQVEERRERVDALSWVASVISGEKKYEVVQEALEATRTIEDKPSQVRIWLKLQDKLPNDLKADVLSAALDMKDDYMRSDALCRLAPVLPGDLAIRAVKESLTSAHCVEDQYRRAKVLSELANTFPASMSDEDYQEAIAAAQRIDRGEIRSEVLAKLATVVPENMAADIAFQAYAAARGIEQEFARVVALSRIMSELPDDLRLLAAGDALETVRFMRDLAAKARGLSKLAYTLPKSLSEESLALARGIRNRYWRVYALKGVIKSLPADLKSQAISEAMATARSLQNEVKRGQALCGLATVLPEDLAIEIMPESLAAARSIPDHEVRVWALTQLASALPLDKRSEIVVEAMRSAGRAYPARAWSRLAVISPEQSLLECIDNALAAACETDDWDIFSNTLGEFVQTIYMAVQHRSMDFRSIWSRLLHRLGAQRRSAFLNNLADYLPLVEHWGGKETLIETAYTVRNVGQWWP